MKNLNASSLAVLNGDLTIRQICDTDLDALIQLASQTQHAIVKVAPAAKLTSLLKCAAATQRSDCPTNEQVLGFIAHAEARTVALASLTVHAGYAQVQHFLRRSIVMHVSTELAIFNRCETIQLCNDFTGCTLLTIDLLDAALSDEACLTLLQKIVNEAVTHWANHLTTRRIFCTIRGIQSAADHTQSPFWQGFGAHFLPPNVNSKELDHTAIANLLPRHPVYTSFLDGAAQRAMGEFEPTSAALVHALNEHHFVVSDLLNCIDGGPVLLRQRQQCR